MACTSPWRSCQSNTCQAKHRCFPRGPHCLFCSSMAAALVSGVAAQLCQSSCPHPYLCGPWYLLVQLLHFTAVHLLSQRMLAQMCPYWSSCLSSRVRRRSTSPALGRSRGFWRQHAFIRLLRDAGQSHFLCSGAQCIATLRELSYSSTRPWPDDVLEMCRLICGTAARLQTTGFGARNSWSVTHCLLPAFVEQSKHKLVLGMLAGRQQQQHSNTATRITCTAIIHLGISGRFSRVATWCTIATA